MNAEMNTEFYRERPKDLMREAQRWQLVQELEAARKAHTGKLHNEEASKPVNRNVKVRWGLSEDKPRIAQLLELNGMPGRAASEEQFVVAEEHGEIMAAVRYRTAPKRLLLELLVVEPWAGERGWAVALYAGARDLAQEIGLQEIRAKSAGHADYPREAGYRRMAGEWRLDTALLHRRRAEPRAARWARLLGGLGSTSAVAVFRTFRG